MRRVDEWIQRPGSPVRASAPLYAPRGFPSPGCYIVVGLLFLVILYSAGLFPSPSGTTTGHTAPPSLAPAATVGNVTGYVFGSRGPGTAPIPLPGVEVNATAVDFVTTVASSITNSSGGYSLTVPPGNYYIWSSRSGAWGGGGVPDWISVSAGNTTLNLTAYPYVGYGNATFVLPA